MSIKVSVYVPTLTGDLLPRIAARFSDLGMECQFHPEFALDPAKDSGLVPVRFRVNLDPLPQYESVDMLSGFEISFKDYRYTSPLALYPSTNEKLKACTMQVIIRMHSTHTSAVRVGMSFAALLAELTDGIVYTPRSDFYLEPQQALEQMAKEITRYETELTPEDWNIVPFSSWPSS